MSFNDEAQRLPAWNEHDGPALEVLAGLRDLFEDAVRRYTAAKQAQGALDYLDLELGAVTCCATTRPWPPRCASASAT